MEQMQAQRYAAATDVLEPLVQSSQPSPSLALNLAIAYARQDRAADAESTLQRVLADRPDYFEIELGDLADNRSKR